MEIENQNYLQNEILEVNEPLGYTDVDTLLYKIFNGPEDDLDDPDDDDDIDLDDDDDDFDLNDDLIEDDKDLDLDDDDDDDDDILL